MTAAAAMPISAFLLPPLDDSAASAPPYEKEGDAAAVTETEDSFMPDSGALSKDASAVLAPLKAAGSTTAGSAPDRAGAGALAAPVPNAALPMLKAAEVELGATGGATALEIGETGTFLSAGLNAIGATGAAFRAEGAAEASPSISRTS